MKTAVIYYSYSGNTRRLAEQKAGELGADLFEATEEKRPNGLKTFLVGCPASIGKKSWAVKLPDIDFGAYEKLIVMGPIWAGHPSPQVNGIVEQLPKGAAVELIVVSGGGKSGGEQKAREHAEARGLKFLGYIDVK